MLVLTPFSADSLSLFFLHNEEVSYVSASASTDNQFVKLQMADEIKMSLWIISETAYEPRGIPNCGNSIQLFSTFSSSFWFIYTSEFTDEMPSLVCLLLNLKF